MRIRLPSAALLAWATASAIAPAQALSAEGVEFYEREIRPLLDRHCFECHGPEVRKPKGGLRLDGPENWLLGGGEGAALVPGDAEHSLLIERLREADEDERMPPKYALSEREIATFARWIDAGAPAPAAAEAPAESVDWEEARAFWAFRPLADAAPPAGDAAHPVDRFLRAKLAERGLRPAPPASRAVLLRRASFALTGLPPTPEEVEEFVRDESPDAWERVVERLLASPHYGERWARHWLDLARYADSNGLDENLTYGHAWRYRDYVVRAFNDDKPFDRFAIEQIAGDLLPESGDPQADADRLIAPTFLALGPKMLAEQDKEKLVLDTVDEQIDVWSRAFLGLTVSCARCHDHKFDPVPASDYYALAGIFRSARAFDNLDHVSPWAEREIGTREEIARARAHAEALRTAREAVKSAEEGSAAAAASHARTHAAIALTQSAALLEHAVLLEATAFADSNLRVDREQWGSALDPVIHTHAGGEQYAEYALALPAAGRWTLEIRYASGERRPVTVAWDGAPLVAEALGAMTGGFLAEHQRWETVATFEAAAGAHRLRLANAPHFPHVSRLLLTPADAPGAAHADVRAFAAVTARAGADDPLWSPWNALRRGGAAAWDALAQRARAGALALDPAAEALLLAPLPPSLAELAARYQVAFALRAEPVTPLSASERAALLPPEAAAAVEATRAALAACEGHAPPPLARAMSVFEAEQPTEMAVLHRGDHLTPRGDPVPRAAPRAASFECAMEPVPAGASGRLQLAQWTADPRNPLTARVMVNRIWQQHFGRGLVASPSNFGVRGDPPTHPELLDWLAREFIASGWSVKAIHRLLLSSDAWRMSSAWNDAAAAADPSNLLLWRREPRRLDAEEVRDALLAASGRLDRTLGGSLLITQDREYLNNDQSANLVDYAKPRRSLYLPVVRNALFEVFTIFDYNDPSVPVDARPRTTVAHQALFVANSPLARESAAALALRARAEAAASASLAAAGAPGAAPALRRAILLAWQREADAEELAAAEAWLAKESERCGEDEAWTRLAQALLMANEFLHLD
jgi:hypothetical protein